MLQGLLHRNGFVYSIVVLINHLLLKLAGLPIGVMVDVEFIPE